MIYALWHGGPSYSVGEIYPDRDGHSDVEVFPSIRAAQRALWDRYDSGGSFRCQFTYADGRVHHDWLPVVTRESEMFLYFYDPRSAHDPYPDRRLYFGPRGAVRMERC